MIQKLSVEEWIKKNKKLLMFILFAILAIRITSYFTLFTKNVGLTRVVKIGLRFMVTAYSIHLFKVLSKRFKGEFKMEYIMILPMFFYCAYLGMGLLSVYWTTDVGVTLLQWAMTFESLIFCIYFFKLMAVYDCMYRDGKQSYSALFAASNCIIGIVFIIGVFVDPGNFYRGTHGGTVHRLGGFIINPNELGMLAVLGMVAVNMEFVNGGNKIWNGIVWGVCFAVLLLTQSRSSLGAWLMVTGYFVMVYGSYTLKAGMIAGVVLGGPVVLSTIVFKDGNVEEVMSMTGRLPFWRDLITDGLPRRPYIGMGFMRIDYHDYFDSIHAYAAKMTHNTFVQVIINLGLIGAWICLWQMIYTFYAVYHSPNKDYQSVAATMLVPIMINSFTEFGIFGESNYGIMFYQIIIMMFTIRAVRIRPGPDP